MISDVNIWFSLFGQKIPHCLLHFGWIAGIALLLLFAAYFLHAKMLSELTGEPLKKIISKPVLCVIGAAIACHILFFFLITIGTVQVESARRAIQDRFGRYPSTYGMNELYFAGKKPDKAFWDYLDKSLQVHRKGMFDFPNGKHNALYEIGPCRFLELTADEKRIFDANLAKLSSSLAEQDKRMEPGIPKYPIVMVAGDLGGTLLPHLNIMRFFCRQTVWRTYRALESGKKAEAVRIAELNRQMVHYTEDEAFLIGGLVAIACYHIYFDSLEQLVEAHALTKEQIHTLSRELLALEKQVPQMEKNALYSEAVFGDGVPSWILSGMAQRCRDPNAPIIPIRSVEIFLPQFRWLLTLNQASLLRFYVFDDFGKVPDARKMPLKANLLLARFFTPGLDSAHKKYLHLIARSRGERVILACELFRMDTGKYPVTAEKLVPKYLDRIPDDPFTGKPLLFRTGKITVETGKIGPTTAKGNATRIVSGTKEIDGIQVWSVGPNGRDNDGISDYKKKLDDTRAIIRSK